MLLKSSTFRRILLVSFLIVGGLSVPFKKREGAPLELLFDPDPVKNDLTLHDDYGVRPVPPHVPSYLLHGQSTYQPGLDEEYF